jgi:hypothetical protein
MRNEAQRSGDRLPFATAQINKEKSNGAAKDLEPSLKRK